MTFKATRNMPFSLVLQKMSFYASSEIFNIVLSRCCYFESASCLSACRSELCQRFFKIKKRLENKKNL